MKTFRIMLWGAIFVLGAFLAWSTVNWSLNGGNEPGGSGVANIGGEFTAQLASGKVVTDKDLLGRPHVMFFGFTHCPDVCPTTLYEASQWLKALGPDGDKVDVYFVTVDPERDTPEVLTQYLSAFDPRIKGITGTQEQIAGLVKEWRVYAAKVTGEDGDYSMDHTATTFLMNSRGKFVRTIAYGEDNQVAIEKLRKLIAEAG